MKNLEYYDLAIGSIIETENWGKIIITEHHFNVPCKGLCVFYCYGEDFCEQIACESQNRDDNKDVYFEYFAGPNEEPYQYYELTTWFDRDGESGLPDIKGKKRSKGCEYNSFIKCNMGRTFLCDVCPRVNFKYYNN